MQGVKLYFKLIAMSFRMQMQHRASFFMLTSALFLSTFVDIIGIWVLFERFKVVKGWSFHEVALLYGIMNMSFSLAEMSSRGFDTFSQLIKSGDFDRVLLRPLGTLFQIASKEIYMMKIGRFLQGAVILSISFFSLGFSFLSFQTLTIFMAVMGATCLFYGLFILQATLAFWTTETLEIMNIVTYGGVEAGQYPIKIFNYWFQLFFTFIVPLACVAYHPIAIQLKHESFPFWSACLFPLLGLAFLYLSCKLWHLGVRKYHSAGS